jgi:hypothetical protein
MFGLEKYRYFFGKPGKGLHRYRIFNIAIVDVVLTLFLAKIIEIMILPQMEYLKILLITFILGILLHRLFGVKTTIDKFLFE